MKVVLPLALLALIVFMLVLRGLGTAGPFGGGDDAPPRDPSPNAKRKKPRKPKPITPARCPARVNGCRSVTGPIVFVESFDPDGDGDLHVIVAAGGISLPGLTAVDVKPSLRPRRDPRIGDTATAAGPVYTGSYGQKQIHALRFAVQR